MTRYSLRRMLAVGLLGTLPVLAACDDETINEPTADAGAMFARYVAFGNSITAGYQSDGINDSTQNQSYAKILADSLGTTFRQPLLNKPGCPAPYTNILTQERLGGTPPPCALRMTPVATVLNNVAVPGAAVIDILDNLDNDSDPNALTTIFLGGRTQMEVATELQPTFATVWIGNNDVLGAALSGNAAAITDATTFASRYNAMVDELAGLGVEGAVLIGVGDVAVAPNLSHGYMYYGAYLAGALPPSFTVDVSCAAMPPNHALVPFAWGFGNRMALARQGVAVTLNCATDPLVLTAAERQTISTAVAAYNQTIQSAAQAKGWAYLDPNPLLASLAAQIPTFPATTGGPPFGIYFSQDGVHPSLAAHQLIANQLLATIRAQYP